MERLRQKDVEAGVSDRGLSDEQKAEIGEIRKVYGARLAQEEILFKSKMQSIFDVDERQKIEAGYRRDQQRLNDERDRKIANVRNR
jgi:hypothetical protein